ncbi:T9SS type A sorting domain-containing protein [Mariniphaga sp.]|uniref:T9SS type A sorting domain-containing protein n=1 Tax=Mariniphaga sp. TaxID=1954475 RepID=UPI00356B2E64
MNQIIFLLTSLVLFNVLNINAFAQAGNDIFPNQQSPLTADYYSAVRKINDADYVPVCLHENGMIHSKNEFLFITNDEPPVLDSIVVESYDDATDAWIKDGIYKWGSEEDGNKIVYNIYFLDELTNAWTIFPWEEYEYDEQERLIREVVYEFSINVKEKTVIYWRKTEHLFTFLEERTEEKTSYKRDVSTGELIHDRKVIQVFDANDNLLKEEIFSWKTADNNWFLTKEFEYAYDENGYQILTSEKSWDYYAGLELGIKKAEFEFDDSGNLLFEINYIWNLDSIAWRLDSKTIYNYQENGKLNSKTGYMWDLSENQWNKTYRQYYEYDSAGNTIKEIKSGWDDSQNDWVNQQLEEYKYDENGNRTFYSYSSWNQEMKDWVPVSKEENLFDNQSNQTLRSYYSWDVGENIWVGFEKFEYEFDENGIKLHESEYTWNEESNTWIGNRKEVYVYDEYGNITQAGLYDWDKMEEDWLFIEEQNLYKYEYDSDGRIISKENLKFKSKSEYAFDETGRYILEKNYVWDSNIEDWRMNVMYEWGYDSEGRMILDGNLNWLQYGDMYYGSRRIFELSETGQLLMESNYIWSNEVGDWIGSSKREITYFEGLFKTVLYSNWDINKNDWQNYLKETYFYSTEIVQETVEINSEKNIKIYPSPAENFIRVQLPNSSVPAQLELFNLSGQKILSAQIFDGEQIAINHFKPGIYSWRLIQNKEIFTGKFVKK